MTLQRQKILFGELAPNVGNESIPTSFLPVQSVREWPEEVMTYPTKDLPLEGRNEVITPHQDEEGS
jgi:hypothetical protein